MSVKSENNFSDSMPHEFLESLVDDDDSLKGPAPFAILTEPEAEGSKSTLSNFEAATPTGSESPPIFRVEHSGPVFTQIYDEAVIRARESGEPVPKIWHHGPFYYRRNRLIPGFDVRFVEGEPDLNAPWVKPCPDGWEATKEQIERGQSARECGFIGALRQLLDLDVDPLYNGKAKDPRERPNVPPEVRQRLAELDRQEKCLMRLKREYLQSLRETEFASWKLMGQQIRFEEMIHDIMQDPRLSMNAVEVLIDWFRNRPV